MLSDAQRKETIQIDVSYLAIIIMMMMMTCQFNLNITIGICPCTALYSSSVCLNICN